MYELPEKFKAYRPQVAAKRHAVAMAQNKCERLQMLIQVNREGLARLNSQGVISHEIAAQRRDYQTRIANLTAQLSEAQRSLEIANGVDEIIDDALAKLNI